MKKLTLILASVFAISTTVSAHEHGYTSVNSYADAFVFDEMGVTFSVYPDGEFDFYLPEQGTGTVSNGYVTATFNSGYNYDPYVQYDDFGAVIQVENVPVYYDYYGRVSQIGDVFINYRNRRVCQVGGLYVYYNRHGHYARHTGFINVWNPYFVYRPWYTAFCRPVVNLCFVRTNPYRQFYRPVRYTYYRPYITNIRPCVATIGHTYRPSGYGVTHHRYTQSAGRGERAVVRSRRKVTTADATPRPTSVNRGRATSSSRGNSTYNRSAVSTKPATNRDGYSRTATNSSGSSKPSTSSRQEVSTKPRTTQTAPSRSRTSSTVNRGTTSSKPSSTVNRSTAPRTSSNSGVSRSGSSSRSSAQPAPTTGTQSTSRPSSSRATTSRQTTPSRSSVSSKPRTSSSTSRATSRPQTSSRSTASKPRTSSSSSITSSSSRGSSSVSKAPSRSSSSRSTSGGSATKSTSKQRR